MLTALARKILEKITPYTPGKPIEEVQRELGLSSVMKLASNENPLGPSPKALEAIRQALPNLHRYPDGSGYYLVRKLAKTLNVSPEQLILGNGSDEVITFAARAFIEPGDEVVIADPTFLIYRIAAQLAQAEIRIVPMNGFRYDLAAMKKAVTPKTKLIFIANPDNPTGTYLTRAEVEAFMQGLPPKVIVFFDEAYAELVDAPDYPDTRVYLEKHPVIIARTFSKAYGLAGLRIGYGLSSAPLIEAMHRVREPFNVNSLAQAAAIGALDDAAHLEATRLLLRDQKKYLTNALKELGYETVPSATNFILFRVCPKITVPADRVDFGSEQGEKSEQPRLVSSDEQRRSGAKDTGSMDSVIFGQTLMAGPNAGQSAEALLKRGIIVRHMKAWNLPDYIRVTIGLPHENQAFIQSLKETGRNHS